jgi:hypothetical protein
MFLAITGLHKQIMSYVLVILTVELFCISTPRLFTRSGGLSRSRECLKGIGGRGAGVEQQISLLTFEVEI